MSERRSTQALFLVFLMLTSVMGQAAANEAENEVEDIVEDIGVVYGDLTNFDVSTGSQYLLIEKINPSSLRPRSSNKHGLTKVAPGLMRFDINRRWRDLRVPSMSLVIH